MRATWRVATLPCDTGGLRHAAKTPIRRYATRMLFSHPSPVARERNLPHDRLRHAAKRRYADTRSVASICYVLALSRSSFFLFLAYPSCVPVTIELPDGISQTEVNLARWTQILADPALARLPHRIETDLALCGLVRNQFLYA
jgi:hypothetical protein